MALTSVPSLPPVLLLSSADPSSQSYGTFTIILTAHLLGAENPFTTERRPCRHRADSATRKEPL